VLTRKHTALRKTASNFIAGPETEQKSNEATIANGSEDIVTPIKTKAAQRSQERRARRKARYNEVKDLKREGLAIREIVRWLGIYRETIRKYLNAESLPEQASRGLRGSKVDRYAGFLQKRIEEGCRNVFLLF